MIVLRGTVFSGSSRGGQLIEKFAPRLLGIIGFKPYPGTLDVELDKNFDLAAYESKRIQHIRPWGGGLQIDAHLAQATVRKASKHYGVMEMRDREQEILDKLKKIKEHVDIEEISEGYPCWAVQFSEESPDYHILEIIAKEELRKVLGLLDGDVVEILIPEAQTRDFREHPKHMEEIRFRPNPA